MDGLLCKKQIFLPIVIFELIFLFYDFCVAYSQVKRGVVIISLAIITVAAACSPEPQRQTDVRRKIKDSWVDWDDQIQAWQRLSAEGQNLIAAVANTKLTAGYVNM